MPPTPALNLFLAFLYNAAFLVFGMGYLPIFLTKIRQAESPARLLRERLGLLSDSLSQKCRGKEVIWVHGVSVGEVMAARKLIQGFLDRAPAYRVVLTTVTPTGQRIAKEMEGERLSVCYFPFDLTFAVERFFKAIRPRCLLLVETEIWPNLLSAAKRFSVPVGIVNARLSPRSSARYGRLPFIFRPLFSGLDFVLAQSEEDALRFVSLGVARDRVQSLGNIKFDGVDLADAFAAPSEALKKQWGFHPQDRIWICGSTHPGEEEILLQVYERLQPIFPSLKLILAPRHIERSTKLAQRIRASGWKVRCATDTESQGPLDVLLLDRLGILKQLYAIADVVFVGGSLIHHGGQNPIEAACFKRAILHGPHTFHFEKVYQALDSEAAALAVRDAEGLHLTLKRLLHDEAACTRLGESAFRVISALQGATQRHLDWIFDFLTPSAQERIHDVEFHEKLFPSAGGRI